MILPRGTGYLTDAGMCGDYNSVIGMQKDEPLRRFVTGMSKERFNAGERRGHAFRRGGGNRRQGQVRRHGSRQCASAAFCKTPPHDAGKRADP